MRVKHSQDNPYMRRKADFWLSADSGGIFEICWMKFDWQRQKAKKLPRPPFQILSQQLITNRLKIKYPWL